MVRFTLFLALLAGVVGCASTDRVAPVFVPDNGATTDYAEFLPKLRILAWRATEAFYRDRWDELDDAAITLEKAVRTLKQTRNVPARLVAELAGNCDRLLVECDQLRAASTEKSPDKASERLQKIHVLIRELRSEN